MESRRIVVAVTGGIAAYKAPDLVRQLKKAGHEVRCALTRSASEFVSPLVLQTLTGEPVRQHLFDPAEEGEIDHIGLADWAELVVVAPATADLIARMVHGRADDLVTAVLLATRAPVLVAPAMNVNMWSHPATRANVAVLAERGVLRVGPEAGELACGWEGLGRMAEPALHEYDQPEEPVSGALGLIGAILELAIRHLSRAHGREFDSAVRFFATGQACRGIVAALDTDIRAVRMRALELLSERFGPDEAAALWREAGGPEETVEALAI